MSETYTGWVPTVLGNLSFKSIGHSGYPYPFVLSFKEDNNSGSIEILCLQKRIPSDYQIPLIPLPDTVYLSFCSFIGSKLFKENIESSFVLIATGFPDNTGTVQSLTGKIYKISKKCRLNQKESYLHLESEIQEESTKIELYLRENSFFVCDFSLNRQGICSLNNPKVLSDGQGCNLNKFEIHKQINQCFFFIKDAFHSHKHHDKSEDTLISSHLSIDKNKIEWSEHVLKELYRYILNQRPSLSKNSLGIFSYIRTFNKIIENENENVTLFNRIVAIDELEKSISIQVERKGESILYKRWFAGFALAVMQMSGFYIYSSNKDLYNKIIDNNLGLSITLATSLLLIVLVFTQNITPKYSKSSIRFVNLIISYFSSKNKAILFLLLSGILVMSIGTYLL